MEVCALRSTPNRTRPEPEERDAAPPPVPLPEPVAVAVTEPGLSAARVAALAVGENRWKYDTFVNWDFLPSEDFPILVYFRETQTPAVNREEVPLVVDELDGQVHFFPAISDAQQLKQQFIKYNCKKIS